MYNVYVIIPAAGKGARMKSEVKKQFLKLRDKPVIRHTLDVFIENDIVKGIVVVSAEEDIDIYRKIFDDVQHDILIISGGKTRQQSVYNGLLALEQNFSLEDNDIVTVHDGARPLVTQDVVKRTVNAAVVHGACIAAVNVKDTVKLIDGRYVADTLPREKLVAVQTPQAFKYEILKKAHENAVLNAFIGTDDASLVERSGYRVYVTEGSYDNIKITTPEDMILADALMRKRYSHNTVNNFAVRVGMGYDVHKLVKDRRLILGGVKIEHYLGLKGHSDADVLVHAIMDALLGACGQRDIGVHFPDTDDKYRGIYSIDLLKRVRDILSDDYFINNIDAVIMAERPRLAPHIEKMRKNIADALKIDVRIVNIKATTTEKLGFVGREEGIAAQAVVSLTKVI